MTQLDQTEKLLSHELRIRKLEHYEIELGRRIVGLHVILVLFGLVIVWLVVR